MENSLAVVDISISSEEDIEKIEKKLIKLAEELSTTIPKLKGKVEVLGIDNLTPLLVTFRIIAPTQSMEHLSVERAIRKAVKLCLDKKS